MAINDRLEKIEELLIKKDGVQEKKFIYPWGKKVSRGQRRNNYVTVIILNENGTIDFKKYQINQQTIMHELIPRLATAAHVMHDKKGNPVIILPAWSVDPLSPKQHFEKSLENGTNIKGFQIIMNIMKSEAVSAKKSMGSLVKWGLGLLVGGIIIYAVITGGGA